MDLAQGLRVGLVLAFPKQWLKMTRNSVINWRGIQNYPYLPESIESNAHPNHVALEKSWGQSARSFAPQTDGGAVLFRLPMGQRGSGAK